MTRTPHHLAALASSAVPGLDPVAVQAAQTAPGHFYEVAFVTDSQHRTWVIRCPVTPAAGAQMDTTVALLGLIGRRLPFSVPAPRGFVAVPEGRAVVYPHIAGRPVDLGSLPPGPGLAAELGRALAALHNLDREIFDEASIPVYDAEAYRTRRLADLDRGAATGHVPSTLLSRWERSLEDVSLWRFAPTPIHGDITGEQVLVVFDDELDATTGRVRGITGWDDAKVADPAEDFAAIVTLCDDRTVETVLEAYSNHRVERPDAHLRRRARLAAEMRGLTDLLSAVSAGRRNLIRSYAAALRELDDRTVDEPDEPSGGGVAPRRASRWLPAPGAAEEAAYDRDSHDPKDWASEHTVPVAAPVSAPASADVDVDAAVDEGATQPISPPPVAERVDDGAPDEGAPDDAPREGAPDDAAPGDAAAADAAPEEPEEPEGPVSDDEVPDDEATQPVGDGNRGDPTTVIPHEELERLRRAPDDETEPAGDGDSGPSPTPAPLEDDRWR